MFAPVDAAALVLLAEGQGGSFLDATGMLWPLLIIGLLFYFMLIRPERRKRAEHAALLDSLKKNDKVVTIGGIFGTVVNVQKGSEEITLRVDEGNNTKLRILRSAVARVISDEEKSETDSPS